ncbi:MAG: GNAT family N-acetyltransferase, partial [bacterium]
VYRRFVKDRTGYLERSERWWKEAVFRRFYDDKRHLNDVALWSEGDGRPVDGSGYLVYRTQGDWPERRLVIQEFVALSGGAYNGLLRYALSHDLHSEVVWHGPVDDPIAYTLDDSDRVKREFEDDLMLRVIDLEAAVAARPAGPGAQDSAFTLAITDAAAPWNQGTWRIECSGSKLAAKRSSGPGDLAMDAATFAAVYDGFLRASDAVRSGLAEASDHNAATIVDRIFAVPRPPFGSDFF